jgi:hypothetical protein
MRELMVGNGNEGIATTTTEMFCSLMTCLRSKSPPSTGNPETDRIF